jgi:hypothetical protein
VRSPLALVDEPGANWIERLGADARRELDRSLRALRRGDADAAESLARRLQPIVAERDAPEGR